MKNNNKKITIILISFLLLIPFRLPVSVILIRTFNYIAQIEGTLLPIDILRANVMVSKITYNIIFSSIAVYNVEMFIRNLKGRKEIDEYGDNVMAYSITYWIGALLFIYLIFDSVWTYDLFTALN